MKITNLAPIDWDKPSEVDGTSYHGLGIQTTIANLRRKLGQPAMEINDGSDKVNIEWYMKLEDGTVFTIYDWKYYRPLDEHEMVSFNIGHHNPGDAHKINGALNKKFLP